MSGFALSTHQQALLESKLQERMPVPIEAKLIKAFNDLLDTYPKLAEMAVQHETALFLGHDSSKTRLSQNLSEYEVRIVEAYMEYETLLTTLTEAYCGENKNTITIGPEISATEAATKLKALFVGLSTIERGDAVICVGEAEAEQNVRTINTDLLNVAQSLHQSRA
tara:strand:- start:561 stop:1058 length:498 start_codon:yes stop_codon:yes gene_type:complete